MHASQNDAFGTTTKLKSKKYIFSKIPHYPGGKWKGKRRRKGKQGKKGEKEKKGGKREEREKKNIKEKWEKAKGFLKYEEIMKMAKGTLNVWL